jgi:TIR domain
VNCWSTLGSCISEDTLFSPLESAISALRSTVLRSIFVSYRRSDSAGEAGRLFDDLTRRFPPEAVFMDVAAIEPGRDFRKVVDQSVATCGVLLAMIGQDWLESKDALGCRRLDDANDFVRIELASALRRDIPVVPVLVQGAKMPSAEQLPEDLKELAYRNAVEVTHARWRSDLEILLQALQSYVDVPVGDASAAHGAEGEKEPRGSRKQDLHQATAAPGVEGQTLERVSKELAVYIGPISEVVVKRAAKRCSSAAELYELVAREIESEADRAKFLRSCRP